MACSACQKRQQGRIIPVQQKPRPTQPSNPLRDDVVGNRYTGR